MEQPVEVYRNLMRKGKVYSIRQNGKVVAHTTEIILENCNFHVGWSSKARVMKTKQRNVHAYIKGKIVVNKPVLLRKGTKVTYNPYTPKGFTIPNGKQIMKADIVRINEQGVHHIGEMKKLG